MPSVTRVIQRFLKTAALPFSKLHSMSKSELEKLGLQLWEEKDGKALMLLPSEEYANIPNGFKVTDIFGEDAEFKKGKSDKDARFGALPYGVSIKVARRFLASLDPSEVKLKEYLTSLLRMVKSGGHFVSAAQAKFFWTELYHYSKGAVIKQWSQSYMRDNPNAFAFEVMLRDERFGKSDVSKIRYQAYLFVIDGAGVKAMAKGIVHYAKGPGDTTYLDSAGPTEFVRDSYEPLLYDHAGVTRELDRRVQENAGLINKVKNLEVYEHTDILQSLVSQLEAGRVLSPAQLNIINQYLPRSEANSLGDPSEWMRTFERGVHAVEHNFIHPAVEFFKHHRNDLPEASTADWFVEELTKPWAKFKAKPFLDPEVSGGMGQIGVVARWVGIKEYQGLTGIGDALATLYMVAKKGQKGAALPKTLLKSIPTATRWVEQYERLSPSRVTQALEKEWKDEFGKGSKNPFDEFDR